MAKAKSKLRPKAQASKAPRQLVQSSLFPMTPRATAPAPARRTPRQTVEPTAALAAEPTTPAPSTPDTEKSARKSHQQPSIRSSRTWTPRMLRTVERVSDGGRMEMLGDLCDQLLADERIRKAFETVVGGLLSLDLTFEASGDGRRRGRAVKALEADEDWYAAFPESELQQFLTMGRLAGVSWGQLRWTAHLKRIVPVLEPWDLRHFRYDWQQRQWYAILDGGVETPIKAGDGQWICYMPYGSYRPWAYGLWRGLAPWWLLKKYAISDWGRTGAVGASYVATPRENAEIETGQKQRKELADDMYSLSQDGGVLVLPNGFELKVVEAMANTSRTYGNQISSANTAIDIAIQGQNLTSEVEGGSRAAATVHAKVETRIIRNVGSTSATCLHDQALIWWASFNFGDASIAPWPIWDTEPPEDTKAEAEGQLAFGSAMKSVQDAGFEVLNAAEIAEKHGLKIKKAEPKEEPVPDPKDPKQNDDGEDEDHDDPPPAPSKKPKAERGAFAAALASGTPVKSAPGFVAGQLHADAIVDGAKPAVIAALKPIHEAIGEAIGAAADFEDLRARLLAIGIEPEALNEVMYRAMALAELTGRYAVTADA
jgi:hypothetical protein